MISGYLSDKELERLKEHHPELRDGRCPTCKDAGTYRWQGQEHDCCCGQQKWLFTRYLHAGIGETYQRLSWTDLQIDKDQLAPVLDYLDHHVNYIDRGMGLLLHGPVGTGKTLLSTLVLKELVRAKYDCYATTFAAAVENFTATWGDKDEKKVFTKRFLNSQVLLLDDLGREQRNSNRLPQTTFEHVLRTRVQHARTTILTTNMTAQELQGGYGHNALSMLVEKSIEVPLTGADYRPTSKLRTMQEIQDNEKRPIV